ncbi:hypothetical protein [Planococcus koreensis]|uniref:hypothetical protein n=1 Tax=Planococcus koreensis TaxID=112331 RepID=UPI0039FBB815
MTAIIKEETRMDHLAKTYLQMYEEFIVGYKQYKKEKSTPYMKSVKAERLVD